MYRITFKKSLRVCLIYLFFSVLFLINAMNAFSIEFEYSIHCSSYHSVEVSINAQLLDIDTLNLYRIVTNDQLYQLNGGDQIPLPPITSIQVTDSQGHPLVYLKSYIQQGGYLLERLSITTSNESVALLTYSLNMTPPNDWHADADSVMVSENLIMFQPLPYETEVTKMTFSFSLPQSWHVVTRLNPENGYYTANLNNTFQIMLDGYRPIILGEPLAFGRFNILETKFGDIRAIAACPTGDIAYMTDASYVGKIFEYQETIMGDPSLGHGETAFLFIFDPDPGTYQTLGTRGGFEDSHTNSDRHLGHEMYHMWQGSGNRFPDDWRFIKIPGWWMEGGNEFLSVSAHLAVGAFTPEREREWRIDFFNQYKTLLDAGIDIPVTDCESFLSDSTPDVDLFIKCQYSKSHSVIWLLDKVLKKLTLGQRSVETFMGFLFNHYTPNNSAFLDSDSLRVALNRFSGYNFKPFFDLYVFGTKPLPLKVLNNELVVLWDQLPEFEKTKLWPDIKCNGQYGPITISDADTLSVIVEIDPLDYSDYPADWWLLADTEFGWYYYNLSSGWLPGQNVTYQGPLFELNPFEVMKGTLPGGLYRFYFGIDRNMNGVIDDPLSYDSVEVNITP